MSTSLSEQLKRLAVPQTSLLLEKKKKPSLLFDPQEAAKFDRDTFYEIGVSGLDELVKLNHRFAEFNASLFDPASKSLERSMKNKEENKKLDKLIRRFLLLLSPYFLVKAAHKTLEWLVNRYHIESFNVDDLMSLILPYHDTRIFVRVLQMIDVSDPAGRWHWLHPLQKPGVPLSKTTLLNRCASDPSFLKFICDTTSSAVKEYAEGSGNALSTLLAFYCTTLIGGLEYVSKVTEVHVTYLLESLIEGLNSKVLDYSAASYMIVAQLVRRAQLSPKTFTAILNRIVKCPHRSLASECGLLLVLMYQSQDMEKLPPIPVKTLRRLLLLDWLPSVLGQLRTSGVFINSFFMFLLKQLLLAIQSECDGRTKICNFTETLVKEALDGASSYQALQIIVESFDTVGLTSNPKSDKTEGILNTNDSVIKWYSKFFRSMEHSYPESFDKVIHKYLSKDKATSSERKALKVLLSITTEMGGETLKGFYLYEQLNHIKPEIRAQAIDYLARNYTSLQKRDTDFVFTTVGARLNDDNVEVLEQTLGFSAKVLVEILGPEAALEKFLSLGSRCCHNLNNKKWKSVTTLLVKCLCSEHLQANDPVSETQILLMLLSFFFHSNRPVLPEIFKQESFITKCKFMAEVQKELTKKEKNATPQVVQSTMIRCLTKAELFNVEDLLMCAEKIIAEDKNATQVFLLLIMIGSSVSEQMSPSQSQTILDTLISCVNKYKVFLDSDKIMDIGGQDMLAFITKRVCKDVAAFMTYTESELPLTGLLYCLLQLSKHTPLPSELRSENCKWWNLQFSEDDENMSARRFTIRMLEVLLSGCSDGEKAVRFWYGQCLKKFLNDHFSSLNSKLRFLINICAYVGNEDDMIDWSTLSLHCLYLLSSLLSGIDASFSLLVNLDESAIPSLLIAAMSPLTSVRHTALNCLNKFRSSLGASLLQDTFVPLLEKIKERKEEIELDAEQLSLVLYTALSPDQAVQSLLRSEEKQQLANIRVALFNHATSSETPLYIKKNLFMLLSSVNSQEILRKLIPLGIEVLSSAQDSGSSLDIDSSTILCNIIQRLNSNTAFCLKEESCWNFVESSILNWKTVMVLSDEKSCPSVLVMKQISREFFSALDEVLQQKLLTLLIKAASDSDVPGIASAAGRAVKQIILECKLIAVELEKMINAQAPQEQLDTQTLKRRRLANRPPPPQLIETQAWRYGITLLEWIQSKKKIHSTNVLLSPLFSLLSKCLLFETQALVEYTKQLILSCLLHCCQKLSQEDTPIEKTVLQSINVEAIVQCIRASQNPQTHHHALLLLAYVAELMPEEVLHNVMAIFTFMGSSILRQDDAYSYQIISKIVETIIPILVKASDGVVGHRPEVEGAVSAVLRVFADTVVHVPIHRRSLVYQKLLTTLGPDQCMWLFVCLVLEGCVLRGQEGQEEMSDRQEFILNLMRSFSPSTIFITCNRIVMYLQSLPIEKDVSDKDKRQKSTSSHAHNTGLFNVEMNTAKQLRHYRYSICTFMSTLLSSPQFVKQVAEISDDEILGLEPLYQELIQNLVTHIEAISHQHQQSMQKNKAEQATKYWNAILNLTCDILDKVNALLPAPMFLMVIRGLLKHKFPIVRRKAMELLNTRLQHHTAIFAACEREAFYNLLDPLVKVMKSIGNENAEPDIEINQQVAMLSIKMLARQLAPEDPLRFVKILERVTKLAESKDIQKNLLASIVLCLAELVSTLRAHSITHLNRFLPAVIRILKNQKNLNSPNLLLLSVVTAILKIAESLPSFLSPYLSKLLQEISIQSVKWQHLSEDSKVSPILHKLKAIRQEISSSVPARVLIPAIGSCYSQLLERRQHSALGPLLSVLADNISSLESSEFSPLMPELTAFFLLALQFRSDSDDLVSQADITEAESHIVKALVALILKLSESTFRPLYHSLFHWATSSEEHKDRIITLYRLSSSIGEALKGLFVLFAGPLVPNAAKLLNCNNLSKRNEEEEPMFDEEKAQLLLQYILETLHSVFKYDSGQGFVNKERFDLLMLPIVDQLENTVGGMEAYQARVSSFLSPCITQFVIAIADDSLWRQLNYQILLKTRHTLPQVRVAALEVLCEMARKVGEDYLPLLPETVPFIAELLEDEEEMVESACQKAVQDLEEILGEPLKKYF